MREGEAKMTHDVWRERLAYYELGRVSDDERAAFERHALECDACFGELERGSLVSLAARTRAERFAAILDTVDRAQASPSAQLSRWLARVLQPRVAAPALGALAVALLLVLKTGSGRDDYRALASFPVETPGSAGVRAPGASGAVEELLRTGRGYLDVGNYGDARRAFRAALARDPGLGEAAYLAGLCSALSGDFESAIGELTAAERLASGEPAAKARWSLANTYLKAGRLEDAIATLEVLARIEDSRGGEHPAAARSLLQRLPRP